MRKHPDVHYYAPAGVNGYLVEQVREIVADTALAPIMAGKKVYILDRVDLLGTAANAFLKTLEEPPADVVLILLGRTRESVLPPSCRAARSSSFAISPRRRPRGSSVRTRGRRSSRRAWPSRRAGVPSRARSSFCARRGNERLAFRGRVLQVMAALPRADDWDVLCWARELVEKAKAPLDDVIAEQEAELAENADFLQKSAIRQIEARNKRQIGAKTTGFCVRPTPSWARGCATSSWFCAGAPGSSSTSMRVRTSRSRPLNRRGAFVRGPARRRPR